MVRRSDGTLELLGEAHQSGVAASCRALVGLDRTLTSLSLDPDQDDRFDLLIGRVVGRGFRAAVDEVSESGTLASVLLSELPVAALLSGYASLYTGEFPDRIPDAMLAGFPVDICAGWAAPASFMVQIRTERVMPTPAGPLAPVLEAGEWHPMPTLAVGSMRRQRLIERSGPDVWAMFRDTHARPDGQVAVLHEYTLTATLADAPAGPGGGGEGGGSVVVSCQATPRVLPWAECPGASASAARLVGRRVSELRAMVKEEMVGTSTCTHLNDLLSSLAQADRLVESPRPGRTR
jgi:hypothetical protein